MRRGGAYVTLALCGACSLHSLDYLEAESGDGTAGSASGTDAGHGGKATGGGSGNVGGDSAGAGNTSVDGGAPAGNAGTSTTGGTGGDGGQAGDGPEEPDCTDQMQTLDETDKDCGGRTCAPCAPMLRCLTGSDCQSAICTNQICQAPSCSDLAVNGDETDLNCGGKCGGCAEGQHCSGDADCLSKTCTKGICASASCPDDTLKAGCPLLVDNTAYGLSPAHALTKCIDDNLESVAEGNAMMLYGCKEELHQTFWAMAKADGYFALRNALSGKCLQVRGASMSENAVIEQAACKFGPEQLWKPSLVDANVMQLTVKLSGLVLDVAGSNVGADSQPIVQGKATGSADTHWHLQKRSVGGHLALSPYDDQGVRVRHQSNNVTLASDDLQSAHWKVTPGLYKPECVSFQSRDEPGRYLRHARFRLWSDTNDGTSIFQQDATFCYASPFQGSNVKTRGLQAVNYSGHFLVSRGGIVVLAPAADTTEFKNGATWWLSVR